MQGSGMTRIADVSLTHTAQARCRLAVFSKLKLMLVGTPPTSTSKHSALGQGQSLIPSEKSSAYAPHK